MIYFTITVSGVIPADPDGEALVLQHSRQLLVALKDNGARIDVATNTIDDTKQRPRVGRLSRDDVANAMYFTFKP